MPVARAKGLGYGALAITDECSLAGVVRAHVAAKIDLRLPTCSTTSTAVWRYSFRLCRWLRPIAAPGNTGNRRANTPSISRSVFPIARGSVWRFAP